MLLLPAVRRPFICHDIFLSYPRKEDTIGDIEIGVYGIFFPLLFVSFSTKKFKNFKASKIS